MLKQSSSSSSTRSRYPSSIMAKFQLSCCLFLFLCIVAGIGAGAAVLSHGEGAQLRRKVGGRTPVKNVDNNTQIQDLGRYCIQHYNTHIQQAAAQEAATATSHPHPLLFFQRVLAADAQVVSGIKYFLKISATHPHGTKTTHIYEAVLVVKPWLHSMELLAFKPATSFTF